MPRVTRRSLASKEDSSSQEESPAKATPTRRGRGAKKEEPVEDVKADEPQEVPAKRGRSSARGAKAEKTETPVVEQKGRGRSRSTRGKKDEEEEKEAPKGRGRGGRSTSARGKKAAEEEETSEDTPTETKGRGGRAARGKKAAEEESEENAEDGATEEDNSTPPAKGRAGRGRAKAVPSPSPRGGRRGRSAPAEEEPAAAEAVKADETKASAESEQAEATATTGRGRRSTPSKPAESPASSGRRGRGRGQKSEETVAASSTAEEEKEENKEAESEAMETDKPSEEAVPEAQQEKQEKEDESSSSKKRKLDEEEAEANESLSAKRARTSEAEPSSETATEKEDELTDFVVVNKEDVPAPDSKEVTDSIAKAIPSAPPSEADSMEKGEENSSSSSEINASGTCMPAPNVPLIVPLTEAELAKQYTKVQRDDKDENSSTMVEVGSEGASDITGVSSVRGFDMSDVDSMDQSVDMIRPDVTAMDTSAPISTVSEVVGDLGNSISPLAQDISLNNSEIPAAQSENNVAAFGSISAAATAGTTTVTQPATTTPTVPPTAPVAPSQNMVNSVALAPKTTQNGSLQEPSPVVNSSPLLTSTPAKGPLNVTSEKYIPSSPSITQRKYIPNPSLSSQQLDPAQCFSVVSYNILADCHLRRYDYSFTEDQYLDQTYRHNLLMKELDYLTGDIVCMQEVGPAYYTNTLNPAMTSRGYTGHFIKRTKDFYEEGEATFVKNSRFEILATQGISLKELAYKEVDAAGLSEEVASAAKRYLDRADVVLLSKLACKNTGKQLTICNIHVVYDLASPDVQCVQVASAIKELVSKAGNDLSPHIICGDFNSEVTSPGYQLAKDGYLSDTHIRNLQAIERMDNKDGSSRSMIHHLWRAFQHTSSNLKSAYETVMGKEPNLTSYNKLTNAALDYLFFSSSSLDVAGALEVLDKQAAMATGGTPNKDIPSDHLSMKAVFKIKE